MCIVSRYLAEERIEGASEQLTVSPWSEAGAYQNQRPGRSSLGSCTPVEGRVWGALDGG